MKGSGIEPEDLEQKVIRFLRRERKWLGDDVVILNGKTILTTDSMIEGVHFSPSYFSCKDIGYKSLAAALSDIAAEGGKPLWYLLNIGFDTGMNFKNIKSIFSGMKELEKKYSIRLIGGDTFRSPKIFISITAGGECLNPITRSGAKSGDFLYITGNIGGSKMGLYALRNNISSSICKYHLKPVIRCDEGQYLNRKYNITSMIDISDGLLIDANHIAEESKKRIDIETSCIPVCPECEKFANDNSLDFSETVLTSGEEYELLFTSPEIIQEDFVHSIGKVGDGKGIYLDGKKTDINGYYHFC